MRACNMSAAMKQRAQKKKDLKIEKSPPPDSRREETNYEFPWTPKGYTAFKILLSARLCAAVWNIVGDCDETYNYWEPMHFLMFGKGYQTWEYSPMYAVRSYAYLWIHALPISLYKSLFSTNKIMLFYILRCVFAFACASCEVYFYKGVCKQFGANTGRITLAVLLISPGMFISSTAFLPSSFCMYMTLLSMGAWFQEHLQVAILSTAASAILGWPFAGILGAPIAGDILLRKKELQFFIKWCLMALVLFLLPSMQTDFHYYGKLVIAPLNIVLYNVFTEHGPNLYGVEPFSYYFLNGFLNFNVMFVLALFSLPCVYLVKFLLRLKEKDKPTWLLMLPMYLWILIFFTRPHKEERFLFPIYPLLALYGAVGIDYLQKLCCLLLPRQMGRHYTDNTSWIPICLCVLFSVLSFSRVVALYQGYHAPLDVYVELNRISSDPKIHTLSPDKVVSVCVGKEWYRFPSNFFLPGNNWNLQFLRSEFRGQLPKPYNSGEDATSQIPSDMNDRNREEMSRYTNITRCHYLIDLDTQTDTKFEPNYSAIPEEWTILYSVPFLDASRSHRLLRAFYIPFISGRYCTYVNYNLLKTTRTKKTSAGRKR
ncbi:alpha-1,2-mannosyltransferase ALG9-like [Ostrea edulis]|uniref:alpha-1,2-mannosyltransferase ALG9-like n=1 Tax=Ostrea edulis TaxID=37623 RepID=UPI0024AEC166|nr:alpha-1,2-mannosyltransferase ALG9-like [Ostrea edulis]